MVKNKIILLMILCIWICCSGVATAQDVTPIVDDGQVSLEWNPNTEADLDGYRVRVGSSSGSYDQVIDVDDVNTHTVTGLVKGQTYYFVLTAYDDDNNESGYSVEVSGIAKDKTAPGIPLNFQEVIEEITINANIVNIVEN